jgi:5-methylcytosine-specific restriction protein B
MILSTKESEFRTLFAQYVGEFLKTPEGQEHLQRYDVGRAIGRKNFEDIRAAAGNGANVTDEVLQRLLPHTNSAAHRASGAWVHVAPAVQKNIKEWFEGAGWTQPEDWPKVALAILNFISECADDPSALPTAAREFADDPHTTGLQTGLLTPILNAMRPDSFLILNNKSRRVVNYFTGNNFKQPLVNYGEANKAELSLVNSMSATMRELSESSARPSDLFDMFAHWLTAIRKHPWQRN